MIKGRGMLKPFKAKPLSWGFFCLGTSLLVFTAGAHTRGSFRSTNLEEPPLTKPLIKADLRKLREKRVPRNHHWLPPEACIC